MGKTGRFRVRTVAIRKCWCRGSGLAPEHAHYLVDVGHVFRTLILAVKLLGDQDLLHNEEAGVGKAHLNCGGRIGDPR